MQTKATTNTNKNNKKQQLRKTTQIRTTETNTNKNHGNKQNSHAGSFASTGWYIVPVGVLMLFHKSLRRESKPSALNNCFTEEMRRNGQSDTNIYNSALELPRKHTKKNQTNKNNETNKTNNNKHKQDPEEI